MVERRETLELRFTLAAKALLNMSQPIKGKMVGYPSGSSTSGIGSPQLLTHNAGMEDLAAGWCRQRVATTNLKHLSVL